MEENTPESSEPPTKKLRRTPKKQSDISTIPLAGKFSEELINILTKHLTEKQIQDAEQLNQFLHGTISEDQIDNHEILGNLKVHRPNKIINTEYHSQKTIDTEIFRVLGFSRSNISAFREFLEIASPQKQAYHPPETILTESERKEFRQKARKKLFDENIITENNPSPTLFSLEGKTLAPFCSFLAKEKLRVKNSRSEKKLDRIALNLALYDCLCSSLEKKEYQYFVLKKWGYLCIYPTLIDKQWKNDNHDTNLDLLKNKYNPVSENGDSMEWHHVGRWDAATECEKTTTWSEQYIEFKEKIKNATTDQLFENLCLIILMTKEGHDMKNLHPQKSFCGFKFLLDRKVFAVARKEMNLQLKKELNWD